MSQIQENTDLISEFKTAISEEISEIEKQYNDFMFVAFDGSLIDKRRENFLYEFYTEYVINLQDEMPIEVTHEDKKVFGSIEGYEESKIFLILKENLGEHVEKITIKMDRAYLLKILFKRFEDLSENKSANLNIAEKVFRETGNYKELSYLNFEKPVTELNESQQKALEFAKKYDVTLIWGPPGTGKTQTLTALAEIFYKCNKKILILSHTNIAIDNVIQKIAEIMKNDEGYNNGKIIRYGYPQIDEVRNNKKLNIDYWTEIKGIEICNKIKEINLKIHPNKENLNNILKYLYRARDIEIRKKIIIKKRKLLDKSSKSKLIKEIEREDNIVKAIIKNNIFNYSKPLKCRHCSTTVILPGHPDNLVYKCNKCGSEIHLEKVFEAEIAKLKARIEEYEKSKKPFTEKLEEIKIEVFNNISILSTTLTKSYTDDLIYKNEFDVIIIDEVSSAPLPSLYLSLTLSKEKVILVGDFKQLPPIAIGRTNNIKNWLVKDIFEITGIVEDLKQNKQLKNFIMLDTQYRMDPSISGIVNALIYNDKLKNHYSTQKNNLKDCGPFPGKSVELLDISKFKNYCFLTDKKSRMNLYSALFSIEIAKEAIKKSPEQTEVAIITPYRAQYKLIFNILEVMNLHKKIVVSTVHRIQGREKDIIILDFVEGENGYVGKLIKGELDSDAMKLLNVAITRARKKLIVILNYDFIKKGLGREDTLNKILGYCEKNFGIDTSFALKEYFIKKENQDFKENKERNSIIKYYDYKSYSHSLSEDLSNCFEEVVLLSLDSHPAKLKEFLNYCLNNELINNININIIYKHKGKLEIPESLNDNFKSKGVNLNLKYDINLKANFIMIDSSIVWFSSCDFLNYNWFYDYFFRLESIALANLLKKYFVKNYNITLSVRNDIDKTQESSDYEPKQCEICSSVMLPKYGKSGPFLSCERYPFCKFTLDMDFEDLKKYYGLEFLKCENCQCEMEIKRSRKDYLKFLSCPICKKTKSFKKINF
ncbi:MAG: AAA domain-containing protein [Candidatus Humimicrobiaceae bacterium]